MAIRTRDKDRSRILFIAPAILWLLTFTLFPLLYSLYLSLHGSRFLRVTHFVGLENYRMVLTDYRFWQAFRVTLTFVVVDVIATTFIGLLLALLFNNPIKGIRLFRTLSTIPLLAAPVAIGYICMIIFYEEGGPINNLLVALGMNGINWISHPFWAKVAVCIADVWQWAPFAFMVLLAALQSVPDEMYEAAVLDTVSSWQTFIHITLPMIRHALVTVVLLRTVEAFKIFDIPFALTNGGPGLATRTLTFNVYTTGLRDQNLGEATAISFLLMIIMLTATFVFFRIYRSEYE